jgi:hypothetical protein
MSARGWVVVVAASVAGLLAGAAGAEPKPTTVDIKPIKDKLLVLQDARGGTYVVYREQGQDPRVFFGSAKRLHEQIIVGGSSDGGSWSVILWAPRIPGMRYASLDFKKDGTYEKTCDGKDDAVLGPLSGAKAAAVLDKAAFLTTAMVYRPHLLARDDAGVYYYVDKLARSYGGKGYRVFVGKKGMMKRMPLVDIASDSAGEVFSTKTGSLRLVNAVEDTKASTVWIKGEKRTDLIRLDPDVNSALIFSELGLYTFLGTTCDNVAP